ncbi:MAG: class I SAM-dependent methyltransferase [Proteobacteria bacterium]|nr:class I SAM-dependent methyltransferase [Pseudomonadota bacterium]
MSEKSKPWDDRYSSPEFYYGREPNDFLKEHAASIPQGGAVLCLAEGEGRNAVFLARLGYRVTAVDQSVEGFKKLDQLAREAAVSVETVVEDLESFPIECGKYDGVVSIWCHVPPALRASLHSRVVQGLRPGGILILEAYHPRQLGYKTGGPPVPELMMNAEDLSQELNGLEFRILREIDREIHEGKGHSGMSAVTQVLAIKGS